MHQKNKRFAQLLKNQPSGFAALPYYWESSHSLMCTVTASSLELLFRLFLSQSHCSYFFLLFKCLQESPLQISTFYSPPKPTQCLPSMRPSSITPKYPKFSFLSIEIEFSGIPIVLPQFNISVSFSNFSLHYSTRMVICAKTGQFYITRFSTVTGANTCWQME